MDLSGIWNFIKGIWDAIIEWYAGRDPAVHGAVIAAVVSVVVAGAVYLANRRGGADDDAREVHRAVTTGPGGEAREALSLAEYRWWDDATSVADQDRRSENPATPKPRRSWVQYPSRSRLARQRSAMLLTMVEPPTEESGPSLNQRFYAVAASMDQLAVTLRRYNKVWSLGRSKRYRRLLGWHAGIHMGWVIWYIGAHCEFVREGDKYVCKIETRFDGAWGRVQDALADIGKYRVERRGFEKKVIRDYVASELNDWLKSIPSAPDSKYNERMIAEADGVYVLARRLDLVLTNTDVRNAREKSLSDRGISDT